MTEIGQGEMPPKAEVKFDRDRDLAAIDHVPIGSAPPDIDGVPFNFERFRVLFDEGKLGDEYFKPLGYDFPVSVQEAQDLQKKRESQGELIGMFQILDDEEQFNLFRNRQTLRFQPVGLINPETGVADPVWRFTIVEKNSEGKLVEVVGEKIYDNFKLNKAFENYFDLERSGTDIIIALKEQKKPQDAV